MNVLQSGRLRHRIEIVQPAAQQDEFGGPITADETVVATVWASIEGKATERAKKNLWQ